MKPEVSVIMYVKNGMPYFERALESVCVQTLSNIEILVVDGGSSDQTLETAERRMQKDRRIRVLHCDKGSVGAQFNLGVHEAKGRYIGIVESDDYILPNMYEEELRCAKENGCDILRADNYIFWGEGVEEYRLRTNVSHLSGLYGRNINAEKEVESVLIGGSFWTGLYRREFLLAHKIHMNESPGAAYQDFGFLFLSLVCADSVFLLPEAFYCYRKDNPASSCNAPQDIHMVKNEYAFLKKELRERNLWQKYKDYFLLWKIRNGRWFWNCLSEGDRERYTPLLYQDLKTELDSGEVWPAKMNQKETELVSMVGKSPEAVKRYLEIGAAQWREAGERILLIRPREAVYIFGTGNVGRIMALFLRGRGIIPKAMTDNNNELWGKRVEGLEVLPPKEVVMDRNALFLVCSENYAGEIQSQLEREGIRDGQIVVCCEMDSLIRFVTIYGRKG